MIYQLAAIAAGLCFALSPYFSMKAVKELGPTQFNKWRMSIVFCMLVIMSLFTGGFSQLLFDSWFIIAISSLIGIFLGDTLLLHGLKRIGPRRNSVVFALNAPLTVILGWLFLDERLPFVVLLATFTISSGVIIAIAFGRNKASQHDYEKVQGRLLLGVSITFGSALCQALSLILVRPAMESGVDPVAASAIRVGIAALCLWGVTYIYSLRRKKTRPQPKMTKAFLLQITLSGFFAMGLGMSLLLFGLQGGDTGVISTLSSISPVASVLLLWIIMKQPPAANAWIGAILVVAGSAILFLL